MFCVTRESRLVDVFLMSEMEGKLGRADRQHVMDGYCILQVFKVTTCMCIITCILAEKNANHCHSLDHCLTLKLPDKLQPYGLYVYYVVHICDFGMLRVK